jgi:3-dehydroquinate synthase II
MVLGRIKIEQRPMLKITAIDTRKNQRNTNESHVFMQQAETVRLISDGERPISVTELHPTLRVVGWNGHGARHLGVSIDSSVEER